MFKMLIDGALVEAGEQSDVINPVDETTIAQVPAISCH